MNLTIETRYIMEFIEFAVSNGERLSIPAAMLTRHGIIAGATGTGKPSP
ncbi:hypothetical protein ACTQ46_08660 [Gallicola sp. Sow4_E12]